MIEDMFPVIDITHHPKRMQGDWAKKESAEKVMEALDVKDLPSQFTVETIIATLNKLIESGDKLSPLYDSIVGYMKEHHAIHSEIGKLKVENAQLQDSLEFYRKLNEGLGEKDSNGTK